jgi:hypothetical protein
VGHEAPLDGHSLGEALPGVDAGISHASFDADSAGFANGGFFIRLSAVRRIAEGGNGPESAELTPEQAGEGINAATVNAWGWPLIALEKPDKFGWHSSGENLPLSRLTFRFRFRV